ncbi:MAG: type III-A CRISPR-associated RAMP protein Csm3, partial [Thermoplasmata archaeon]
NIFGRTTKEEGYDTVGGGKIKIEKENVTPTRLIVRDAPLTKESEEWLREQPTDLEYTEVKFENVIDRITSAANPRQMERVPAGAEFEFEMIYNVFNDEDKDNLKEVFKAMKLLEDDYLGSSGTRGYGKISFRDIKIYWNSVESYREGKLKEKLINEGMEKVEEILQNFETIRRELGR